MEVILLQRVEKLGFIGDIVNVKNGYAKNYLIPNKKCLKATEENKIIFESRKATLELEHINNKKEAEVVSAKIEGQSVIIIRNAGESGYLYGSVKPKDIADAFQVKSFVLDKNQVAIPEPLKTLGVFNIKLMIHSEVETHVLVNIARSSEEAEVQMDKYKKALNNPKDSGETEENLENK